jgi:dTDP-4-amino-4,6-dideoxygalactose transaminase
MNKKPILVTRSSMPPIDDYIEAIRPIWDSCWLTNMAPIHNEFEMAVKKYLEVPNVSLFTNGHLALELAIEALDLTGEVITTPFTFASTTHAIVRRGLTPVFCDVNIDDYTIDASKIESLITEKTSAIMPVHVYGNVCDIEKIDIIAKKYNLKVLYDAAHAFGVKINERTIGTFGDMSMFSFHATKVFNTIEGGALTYTDERYNSKLYNLKNFGIQSAESVNYVGSNAKMNEFQAAMGMCNLKYIDEQIALRKKVIERYNYHLSNIAGINLSQAKKGTTKNYAYYPVVFDEKLFGKSRDKVCEDLAKENIFARKYFYPLISDFGCYKGKFDSTLTPVAKTISKRVLTLPLYADLSLDDVDIICNIILNKNGSRITK